MEREVRRNCGDAGDGAGEGAGAFQRARRDKRARRPAAHRPSQVRSALSWVVPIDILRIRTTSLALPCLAVFFVAVYPTSRAGYLADAPRLPSAERLRDGDTTTVRSYVVIKELAFAGVGEIRRL